MDENTAAAQQAGAPSPEAAGELTADDLNDVAGGTGDSEFLLKNDFSKQGTVTGTPTVHKPVSPGITDHVIEFPGGG